jgi:hypothetical protein
MAALSAARDTKRLGPDVKLHNKGVAAATKIYQGSLVVKNASGYAAPATAATGLTALGRAEETVDNTAGSNGALKIEIAGGIYLWDNGESITIASIGAPAYANDDHTIYTTSTGRSQVGVIYDVVPEGVWVETSVVADRA